MALSTNTKLMAVIGDPIDHSLSPFLHSQVVANGAFDAVYAPFRVRAEELGDFCRAARTLRVAGFNATMPHKQALLDLVDEVDKEAALYGAINTVKCDENRRLIGYNTDVRGLFMALERSGAELGGARIVIIGAGGVAGSLVHGCESADVASVAVLNRTYDKAVQLCDGVEGASALEMTRENLCEAAHAADIIVNCTSLGMCGVDSDFDDLSFLDNTKALICDLIYNPWETRLLHYAKDQGLKTMNGIDMLIYQGLLAFEILMDVELDCHAEHDRILPLCKDYMDRLKNK